MTPFDCGICFHQDEASLETMPAIISPVCREPGAGILGVLSTASSNPAYSLTAKWHLSVSCFKAQTGCLANMANTKASERQIFNWSTFSSTTTLLTFFSTFFFTGFILISLACLFTVRAFQRVRCCFPVLFSKILGFLRTVGLLVSVHQTIQISHNQHD